MKCKQCGKEYEPKRKSAVFCSDTCRKAYNYQLASKMDNSTLSVTDKVSVTDVADLPLTRMVNGEEITNQFHPNYHI